MDADGEVSGSMGCRKIAVYADAYSKATTAS